MVSFSNSRPFGTDRDAPRRDAWRDGPAINSGSYCYFMDFLSYRCTSIEVIEGKPTLVWKWSSDPDWYSKIEPMRLVEKRRNARRKKGLPPEPIPTSPLREMALYNRQQQYPDAVETRVEIKFRAPHAIFMILAP